MSGGSRCGVEDRGADRWCCGVLGGVRVGPQNRRGVRDGAGGYDPLTPAKVVPAGGLRSPTPHGLVEQPSPPPTCSRPRAPSRPPPPSGHLRQAARTRGLPPSAAGRDAEGTPPAL